MSYIGKAPSVGVRDRYYYTATGGETSISGQDDANRLLTFTDGKYVDVMLNGITLVAGTDYVTTTTNTISGLDALADSDIVEVVVYDVFAVADTVSASRGGTFEGGVTFNGPITINDSADIPTLTGTSLTFDSASFTRISGDLIPLADSTYDLGTPSLKWKDLYLSGSSIFLGDVTLKDEGGSLAVQTSDGGAIDLSARSLNADSATITGNITAATLTGVYAGFDSDFGDQTTDQLSEGSNLYYTTVRGDSDTAAYLTANSYATEAYVDSEITVAVTNLVGGAPGALDTLNELAEALNDDSDFAGTVTSSIATKWTQDNTKISNWDTAFGWGDHGVAGYADSDSVQAQFDAIVTDLVSDTTPQLGGTLDANGNTIDMGTNSITDTKVGQWDTAFGWGDHAAAGYADSASVQSQIDAISVTPADVSDEANTSTGFFDLPAGTTAQRPGSPTSGNTRFNTDTDSLEFYDGTSWINTNLIPTVDSVTGTIYADAASNLTVSATNVTDTVTVRFSEGGSTVADVTDVDMSSGSASVAVPAAVYGQTAGDTIAVSVINQDGTLSSNSVDKTVAGLPTGGSINTYSTYRSHTFTSSGTFTVPSGFSATMEYLILAGGGGGGTDNNNKGGGGGAGGMATYSSTISSGSYSVTVGGGGAGSSSDFTPGSDGQNSVFNSQTLIGGGGGGTQDANGRSGGSGGGAGGGGLGTSGGSGTSGQGNRGGNNNGGSPFDSGGGGGKGSVGNDGGSADTPNGGSGATNNYSTGSNITYAAGGGGTTGAGGSGGIGGVGADGSGQSGGNGTTGRGSGGGGGWDGGSGGNGSGGVVVIRYQI